MVWYDISEIKDWEGHFTGIQRVISEVGKGVMASKDIEVRLCYLDRGTNTYRESSYNFQPREYTEGGPSNQFNEKKRSLVRSVARRLPQPIKRKVKALRVNKVNIATVDNAVEFSDGDTLFLPGAFWIYPFDALQKLKSEHSLKVLGVMYDLVPLAVPQYTAKVTVDGFSRNFKPALETVDTWLSISEHTKKDLLHFAALNDFELNSDNVKVFKLGGDTTSSVRGWCPDSRIEKGGYAMFVSTLEARKNQSLVYQAIKLAKARKKTVLPVVLVGKRGWLSDDLAYILDNDQEIRDDIIWLEKVDDAGLSWLYANSAFTIYPSFYEGWGLPVAESLAYHVPCIASSTSSIPEVGGSHVEYFSPYDAAELMGLIAKYSEESYLRSRRKLVDNYVPATWRDTTKAVVDTLIAI